MTGDDKPTVLELILQIMKDVTSIGKTDFNKHFGFSFRGIEAVLDEVAPRLRDYGVLTRPVLQDLRHFPVGKDGSKIIVIVAYTFVGVPRGDEFTVVVPGEANDTQAAATSKAMSLAYRTALTQALAIATGERDPEAGPLVSTKLARLREDVKKLAAEKEWTPADLRGEYWSWSEGADIEMATEQDLTKFLTDHRPKQTMQRPPRG